MQQCRPTLFSYAQVTGNVFLIRLFDYLSAEARRYNEVASQLTLKLNSHTHTHT